MAEARQRIEAAGHDQASVLNLAGLTLTELPGSLARLDSLRQLDLAGNPLTGLPGWIGDLTYLTHLHLSGSLLTSLPASAGNLATLQYLDLNDNRLTSLPDTLGRLTALKYLDLSGNRLTTLPDSFAELTALRFLVLSGNRLAALPEWIGGLTALRELHLHANRLTDLPGSLGDLTELTHLHLRKNRLTVLPETLGNLDALRNLTLDDSGIVSPPPEVIALGTSAILAFLRDLRVAQERQWSSKMLVVGEAAVGKTSVTKALCGLPYDRNEPQTHGVHVESLVLDHPLAADDSEFAGIRLRLGTWDFGGQLEYRATQRFYLSDRSLFLVVWNSRRGWRVGGQVVEWLEAIGAVAPLSPILLVATHTAASVVDLDEAGLQRRFPQIAGFARVDCSDGTGIDTLREQITGLAARLPLMGQAWPKTWVQGARALAEEPGRYVTLNRSEEIMSAAGLTDGRARSIVRAALHDRGEILHMVHEPELSETVVLQPMWVDKMITRVLDSQEVSDRGGLLSMRHRNELWSDLNDLGLPTMLLAMMERFDLAYRTDAPGSPYVALVVERLPVSPPERWPASWEEILRRPGASELRLRYKLSSRQAGIPSWFIAREHRFATGIAWSNGVLLEHRGLHNPALALLEDDGAAQPTLSLAVRGTAPSAYVFYSILDEGFTRILSDRYPGLSVRRMIPCPCTSSPEGPCSQEFDFNNVQRAVEHGLPGLQCYQSFESVDPRALLLGLRPTTSDAQVLMRLAEIGSAVQDVREISGRIEAAQLRVLDTVRDLLGHRALQGAHCPGIFTLTKAGISAFELQLYCEQPDGPHPLPDGEGVYRLSRLPRWVAQYAPYLRMVLMILRFGMPVVGPAVSGFTGITLTDSDKNRLEASCKLLEAVTALPPGADERFAALPFQRSAAAARTSADFAALRTALMEIDPDFGGLRPRQLPENGGIAYLCAHHRQALRYPQQMPEPPN